MPPAYVDRRGIQEFLSRLGAAAARSGRLSLVGETTHAFEGWRERTDRLACAVEVTARDRIALADAIREFQTETGVEVLEESPGDVIPLPAGYQTRARPVGRYGVLDVFHFDPYSVAFRLIARGDEPDYQAVLVYLEHGWLDLDEVNARLVDLLPRFTNETIQQDPAEFRRKWKGLLQMWRAAQPARVHL
jgi:hypothetical protein